VEDVVGLTAIAPFRLAVSDAEIADLRSRLEGARWPDQLPESGWDYGADGDYLRRLCKYWRTSFDWRAFEARFNRFPHYVADADGQRLHFYHLRSPEPAARPLIITHGWPGSVAEFLDVMGPLSDPAAHGGDPADAFHVVAPSLPGFGFSGPTQQRGYRSRNIAEALDGLMRALGYETYFAQGGDWGMLITILLAASYPDRVKAIHLNFMTAPPPNPHNPAEGLDAEELEGLKRTQHFMTRETGYQAIQSTKPQTLAYGLTDSPAGLASWIVEKFRGWSDCGGDVERSFSRDRLLDNISVYWLTGTINSSMRLYYEEAGPGRRQPLPDVSVPTGHAVFPAEIMYTPRRWAEAKFNIARWHKMPRGGHFAAMEVPDLYVDEVRTFFRDWR
jgi:pimeloyl-ACP methyl ester carboxylesterase